jgi:hypothetical protein
MRESAPKTYKELQSIWLERLQLASERYRESTAAFRLTEKQYRDRTMPSPDGDFALRNAVRLENQARAEYARILRTFTDLLLNGTIPEEPPTDPLA